jgi:hypothetical protein
MQYEGAEGAALLQQERTYTTLGWLQATAIQLVLMWLWATHRLPSIHGNTLVGWLQGLSMTYWREVGAACSNAFLSVPWCVPELLVQAVRVASP